MIFAVAVMVLPGLAVGSLGIVAGFLGERARSTAQVGLVAMLAGVGGWRMAQDQFHLSPTVKRAVAAGVVSTVVVGLLRWLPRTRRPTASFLRFAGAASIVVLLGQFLLGSPTGRLAFGDAPQASLPVTAGVATALGDDPPPQLLVVFDGLSTKALLDGDGRIDAELFPNFASLADDATWYRNHTTVAAFTGQAVPTILTGRHSDAGSSDRIREPENLFTFLGGSYNLQVKEQVTQLCPPDLCPRERSVGVGQLLADAIEWWRGTSTTAADDLDYDMPGTFGADRYTAAESWIAELDPPASGRPDLYFLHVVLPHGPYMFTDDGTLYRSSQDRDTPTGVFAVAWTRAGVDVGRQRYLLQVQASDALLGQLLDELRAAGTYDDALVVVTADHGDGFVPEDHRRALTATNLGDIAWVPLLVKEPGQTDGVVNDDNLMTVDIVPTIADVLGVELPWEVDGLPADRVSTEREANLKLLHDDDRNVLRAAEGEEFVTIDGGAYFGEVIASDPAPGIGPDAIWKLTPYGDLFGRSVAELSLGEDAAGTVHVEWPDSYDDVELDNPLPLEVVASTDLEVGEVVAFALNGTVGALGEVQDEGQGIGQLVHGLIAPQLFVDGHNRLAAYLVQGPVGEEVLRPLNVEF